MVALKYVACPLSLAALLFADPALSQPPATAPATTPPPAVTPAASPVAGSTAGAPGQAEAQDPKQKPQPPEIEKALKRFRSMEFDEALKLLQTATTKEPELPPAQLIMAQWFSRANRPVETRQWLERAVKEEPGDPEAFVIMAELAQTEGRITDSELLLLKAKELLEAPVPTRPIAPVRKQQITGRVLSGMAGVAEARESFVAAQKHLEALLAVQPQNTLALQRLARVLFLQKRADEALERLREVSKLDPTALAPEAAMARLLVGVGAQDQAVAAMDAAVAAGPKHFPTLMAAVQFALEVGDYDKARDRAAAALALQADSIEARFAAGVVAIFRKEFAAAEEHFQAVLQRSPAHSAASNNLALALAEQKDPAKKQRALEYALVNARQFPNQSEALSTLGWVYYQLGRLDEAEDALRRSAAGGRIGPQTAYYLARVAVDRGRKAEAQQLLEGALKTQGSAWPRKDAEALLEDLK